MAGLLLCSVCCQFTTIVEFTVLVANQSSRRRSVLDTSDQRNCTSASSQCVAYMEKVMSPWYAISQYEGVKKTSTECSIEYAKAYPLQDMFTSWKHGSKLLERMKFGTTRLS